MSRPAPPRRKRATAPRRLVVGVLSSLAALAGCQRGGYDFGLGALADEAPPLTAPLAEPPEPRASYRLQCRLDAESHTIQGSGTIVWVNTSTRPVGELYFHLYLNAFKSADTLFLREGSANSRSAGRRGSWGHVEIRQLELAGPTARNLLPELARHSPGDALDETDLRLPLPEPVEPGDSLTLRLRWESQLPSLLERTGFRRDFHFAGQWYPKLAKLEPDGSWAHFAFHPLAEFYADFADLDVSLDVPESMVVAATGQELSRRIEGGRKHLRFAARAVHDFAWAAWPHFLELVDDSESPRLRLLYPPGHEGNARATREALRGALAHFRERYGPYPQPTLTVVHPPRYAAAAGGMEYPTLITTGGPWYSAYFSQAVETVAVHELGHQWFQGLLANDEARWPFLDEGVDSFAEGLAMQQQRGAASAASILGWPLSAEAVRRWLLLRSADVLPIASAAKDFSSFDAIGATVYARTALLLRTFRRVYGRRRFDAALRRYALSQRYAHPDPEDFIQAFSTLGPLAAENLRGALFRSERVDYAIGSLRVHAARPGGGAAIEYQSEIQVENTGKLRLPVDVALFDAKGNRYLRSWPGDAPEVTLQHRGPSPIVAAWVDPEAKILVDDDLLNNSRTTRSHAASLTSTAAAFLELALLALAP